MSAPMDSTEWRMAVTACRAGESKGASDIVLFDVSSVLGICDYFVVMSVSSMPMARAVSDEIERRIQRDFSRRPTAVEGSDERKWTLIDYGDIVVHVFAEAERGYYRIERLYADAPRLDWTSASFDSDDADH